jgi:hypothetical protein
MTPRWRAKFFFELDARDVAHQDGYVVDQRSEGGRLYAPLSSDPLLATDPSGLCDCFVVLDEMIVFLRRSESPATLAGLERAQLEQERAVAKSTDEQRRFRARQPQHVLRVADLPGHEEAQTLKSAAEMIESMGGKIARDELGQVVVSVPERLLQDSEVGFSGILEREQRQLAARAAETLSRGRAVVFAALEQASNGQPLSSLLPDERQSSDASCAARRDQAARDGVALRALAREERRRLARVEARRARKLKALTPWAGSTADERAQWSRNFPSRLD